MPCYIFTYDFYNKVLLNAKILSDNAAGHVHHVSGSNHIDGEGSTKNRRIDNEVVRELVDCGGSDLGFCDMNSRYPG